MKNPENNSTINQKTEDSTPDSEREYQKLEEKFGFRDQYFIKNRIAEIFRKALFSPEIDNPDKSASEINKWGKIFLDVNGLKAVNDLAGHRNGDIFLDRVAEVFHEDETIKNFCLNKGLFIEAIAREGGDEFSFLIRTDNEAELRRNLSEFRNVIIARVEEVEISDLIDFESEKVREGIGEIGQKLLKEARGREFKFFASISGGECCFFEVLEKYLNDYEVRNGENRSPDRIADELMGEVQDLADERSQEYKELYKKSLRDSGHAESVFTAFLLTRTAEGKELLHELMRYKEALGRCEKDAGRSYLN